MTVDYCDVCGREKRKWIADDNECQSMCVEENCPEWGVVRRAIVDITNFKIMVTTKK